MYCTQLTFSVQQKRINIGTPCSSIACFLPLVITITFAIYIAIPVDIAILQQSIQMHTVIFHHQHILILVQQILFPEVLFLFSSENLNMFVSVCGWRHRSDAEDRQVKPPRQVPTIWLDHPMPRPSSAPHILFTMRRSTIAIATLHRGRGETNWGCTVLGLLHSNHHHYHDDYHHHYFDDCHHHYFEDDGGRNAIMSKKMLWPSPMVDSSKSKSGTIPSISCVPFIDYHFIGYHWSLSCKLKNGREKILDW